MITVETIEETNKKVRKEKIKSPSMYQVVLLNDDYTTVDFVVMLIQQIFNKSKTEAEQITLKIHYEGKGVCGVYSKDIAETKVEQVLISSINAGFPLQAIAEKI